MKKENYNLDEIKLQTVFSYLGSLAEFYEERADGDFPQNVSERESERLLEREKADRAKAEALREALRFFNV